MFEILQNLVFIFSVMGVLAAVYGLIVWGNFATNFIYQWVKFIIWEYKDGKHKKA